jgi:hypothetical protein
LGSTSNLDVTHCSDLTSDDDTVSQAGAAGDPRLRANDTMHPNLHIVCDLDEIIDFGAGADPRAAKAGTVDCRIRANLHVVIDLNYPGLWDFDVASILELEPEAVAAQDDPAMQNHSRPHHATCADRNVIRELAIFTNLGVVTYVAACAYYSPRTDYRAVFDDCVGLDADSFSEAGTESDDSRRVNTWRKLDRGWRSFRENLGKRERRVLATNSQGRDLFVEVHGNEHRSRAACLQARKVLGISEESDISRPSLGDACDSGDPFRGFLLRSKLAAN